MNERIEKLASQHFVPDHRDENGRWVEYPHYEFESEELQEFAEQIIKECAIMFTLTHTDEQYPRRIDKTILKHFGIIE